MLDGLPAATVTAGWSRLLLEMPHGLRRTRLYVQGPDGKHGDTRVVFMHQRKSQPFHPPCKREPFVSSEGIVGFWIVASGGPLLAELTHSQEL